MGSCSTSTSADIKTGIDVCHAELKNHNPVMYKWSMFRADHKKA